MFHKVSQRDHRDSQINVDITQIFTNYARGLMNLNVLMVLKNNVFWYFTKFHKGITESHKSISIAMSIQHKFHKSSQIFDAS